MARIRTIKPEFFRHSGLYEAEKETGLPLRLAFAGLWTAADREGRFAWKPRELKLDCLPHDDVDFSRVLDALAARGFIVRYTSSSKEYGCIPTWRDHQFINNREIASVIPPPSEGVVFTSELTREGRVNDASTTRHGNYQGEGKGREGKGKENNVRLDADGFDDWYQSYPRKEGRGHALKAYRLALKKVDAATLLSGAKTAAERFQGTERRFIPLPATWLNGERWADQVGANEKPMSVEARVEQEALRGLINWSPPQQ
jgi:hypothetical protein